jgi:hypothetical protein
MIVLGFLFSLIVFSLQGMESGLESAPTPITSLIGDNFRKTMADTKVFVSGIIAGDPNLVRTIMPKVEHLPPRWVYPLALTGTGTILLIVLLSKGYLPV